MATSNKIKVTDLEFDEIKSNLKAYLSAQDEFQDYDFEGSGMSVLIDMLAYNTHYTGYYANMLGNEMFMDSSSLRDSVVSHAKHLGVTPTSVKTPTAELNFTFTPSGAPTSLTIAKDTKFTTSIDGTSYTFVTNITTNVPRAGDGSYVATGVEIKEGKILNKSYTVDSEDTAQRFIIPNVNVDASTISVVVQNSDSDTDTNIYTDGNAIDVTTIKGTDKVFFLQEIEGRKYEITFGDGAVGKQLSDGNIIFIEYIVTGGTLANKASVFTAVGSVATLTSADYILTTNTEATGGADIQTTTSLKFQAPKLYQAQNRATTRDDYKAILLEQRPDIESITAYGGEDADPVQYGKVFIAVKPSGNNVFTNVAKTAIEKSILKQSNVVTVIPVIIDPIFIYLLLNTTVNYDPVTNLTDENTLKTNINTSIQNYHQTNLEKFDQKFRYSMLTQDIDNTNDSIRNNRTTMRYQQRIAIETLDTPITYTLNFNNALQHGNLISSSFIATDGYTYTLVDDTIGNIKAVKLNSGGVWTGPVHIRESSVLHTGEYHYAVDVHDTDSQLLDLFILPDGSTDYGTIDYATGKVILNSFRPVTITDGNDYIKITVTPTYNNSDITPLREQILTYDVNDTEAIVINMVAETI